MCSADCLSTLLVSGWQPPLPQDGLHEGVHRHCQMSLSDQADSSLEIIPPLVYKDTQHLQGVRSS